MANRRRFLANAALAVGFTLLTVVFWVAVGELVLRHRHGAVPPGPPSAWKTYHAQRGWALRPGQYSYFDSRAARRVDVSINDAGLRNAPLAPEPMPGVARLTILGDSFVFGAPLDEPRTITGRLQALAGPSYEIVNVAVPGYGTGQEYLLAAELLANGYRLGGKVVLAFFTNDLQDNLALDYSTLARNPAQPAFRIDALGQLQWARPQAPHGARRTERSASIPTLFLAYLRYQAEVVAVSSPMILKALDAAGLSPSLPRTPGVIAGWYTSGWEGRWAATEEVLAYVVRALQGNPEAPEVLMAFIPSPFQVQRGFQRVLAAEAHRDARYAAFLSDPDRPQRALQAAAGQLGVRLVDFTPALRRAAEQSLVYFPREGHFNELGSAIAAQLLYDEVISASAAGF
ncbi:MAG TPA: hypothetical protein VFZ81_01600 [Burkholderiales bacterium]